MERLGPAGRSDQGFVTVEYVAAAALSMVLLVVIANFIVFEYGHGVVRAAVDQGVRAGARAGAPALACQQAAQGVLNDLLGGAHGSMGRAVTVTCTRRGPDLDARAQAQFTSWLPGLPGWSFQASATAPVEGS